MVDPNFKSTITDNNDITELKELVHSRMIHKHFFFECEVTYTFTLYFYFWNVLTFHKLVTPGTWLHATAYSTIQ